MQSIPERLAALEERVLNVKNKVDGISDRVDEIYSLIQRGKGAKWVVVTLVSMVSGAFGIIAHKMLSF